MPNHAPQIAAADHIRVVTRPVAGIAPSIRALRKSRGRVSLVEERPRRLELASDVRLAVAYAGLCRTDVYVASGRIPSADPVVLGHEFSAIVEEVGAAVTHLVPGDRVAVFPWIGCGACDACAQEMPHRCAHAQMLGVDRDGAFAQSVTLPACAVYPIPDYLPLTHAAYAEPVAAAMAILDAGIEPDQRGLVLGSGRIAGLTRLILDRRGFRNVAYASQVPTGETFDFAIETRSDDLEPLCIALRLGGLLVIKSRPAEPSLFPHALAVRKELRLHAVHYAPFRKALALLPELAPDLDALIAPPAPLEDHERLFAMEEHSEDHKLMFELAGEG